MENDLVAEMVVDLSNKAEEDEHEARFNWFLTELLTVLDNIMNTAVGYGGFGAICAME